jgi:hypothetical protein
VAFNHVASCKKTVISFYPSEMRQSKNRQEIGGVGKILHMFILIGINFFVWLTLISKTRLFVWAEVLVFPKPNKPYIDGNKGLRSSKAGLGLIFDNTEYLR